jgi:hypothetical protein
MVCTLTGIKFSRLASANMEYLYTKQQAAQLRQKLMDEYVIPLVRIGFRKYPQLRSATLLVAQYWNDEADDAVHDYFIFSVLDTPDLEAAAKAEEDYLEDTINMPRFGEDPYLAGDARDELEKEGYRCYWHDNGDAIPAFAAFCCEGAHQELSVAEAYTPYAILRRSNDDITVEIVGQMLRSWLDGIKPIRW